jgi:putative membrane protein
MGLLSFIVLTIGAIVAGTGIGIVTGLLPGLHTNNIAAILVAAHVPLVTWLLVSFADDGLDPAQADMVIICLIASAAITHTFVNFVPATFLGAAEGDTALSILPGHRLLLEGRGNVAVRLSAQGSLGALIGCLMAVGVLKCVMGPPVELYERSRPFIPVILMVVVLLLVLSEGHPSRPRNGSGSGNGKAKVRAQARLRMVWATIVFLISGAIGFLLLETRGFGNGNWVPVASLGISGGDWMLVPLFTGLFGFPTLLLSAMSNPAIPEQTGVTRERITFRRKLRGLLTGTVFGALVGWCPGITSAEAGVIAAQVTPRRKEKLEEHDAHEASKATEEFIVSISSINTANAISNFVALFVIMRARSGAARAVGLILEGRAGPWDGTFPPWQLGAILVSVLVSGLFAYKATLVLGRSFSEKFHKVPYRTLVVSIMLFLVILVVLFSGPLGLVIMLVATTIGLVPPLVGVKRVHLMGCLILPLILTWTGIPLPAGWRL